MPEHETPDRAVFNFDRIYLKDISFESPRCPQVFGEQDFKPKIDIQLHISHRSLDQTCDAYEVVLKATATAKTGGDTAYLVEVQQAGIFTIAGFPNEQVEQLLEATCPSALFPFLRETMSGLVNNGGFPPLLLQPVNFDTMYQQKKASEQVESVDESITH